jgi:NADH-quinone oxidoreductase subunit C
MTTTDVDLCQWHDELAARARDGYLMFDMMAGIDDGDGVIVVCSVLRPGRASPEMLQTRVDDGQQLASVADIWPGAAWPEREVAEMFGVAFDRPTPRLLTREGAERPLRKPAELPARGERPWPGLVDPTARPGRAARRRALPPGVPGGGS